MLGGRRKIFAQVEDIAHYASLREAWATVLLDRKGKTPIRVSALEKYRGKHHEYHRDTIERYRQNLAMLTLGSTTLDGNVS